MKRNRRGQTLVIALAILFLLVLLGGLFVTTVVRNLQRVTRQGSTDDSLTLALAGLQYAAQQFRSSQDGADWRPQASDPLWRTPTPPAGISQTLASPAPAYDVDGNGVLDAAELRRLDPDYQWLSPGTLTAVGGQAARNPGQPYVRFATGRGRFLLRVSYLPAFRFASAFSEGRNPALPDEFDSASGLVRIEVIGRPGEFDANDPSFFARDATDDSIARTVGTFRKIEAYVPIGLVDQLWWITNVTSERGPASLGVPPYRHEDGVNPGGLPVEYPSLFQGTIRSNVDLQFYGSNTVDLYPARGEGIFVRGKIRLTPATQNRQVGGQPTSLRVRVFDDNADPGFSDPSFPTGGRPYVDPPQAGPRLTIPPDDQDDRPDAGGQPDDDQLLAVFNLGESGTPQFNPVRLQTTGRTPRQVVLDDDSLRGNPGLGAQSTRMQAPPVLDQVDPSTGISRWLELTRDSGASITIDDGGQARLINTGWYGLTDPGLGVANPSNNAQRALAAQLEPLRARGLYIDNFGDIQFRRDRTAVKNEWLRRGGAKEKFAIGWIGDHYTPSVEEEGWEHPVAEIFLIRAPRDPSLPVDPTANPIVPKLRLTRYDRDPRQMNLAPSTGQQREFYGVRNANPNARTADLVPLGQSRDFEYPVNGVVYCEGSVRVRGMVGTDYNNPNGDPVLEAAIKPRSLTLVSGGTIYVEGNISRASEGWHLALLAQDFITVNPTAFTRIRPHGDVRVEADTFDPDTGLPLGYHYTIPQGGELDFSIASAETPGDPVLHLKHTGVTESTNSQTAVTLSLPSLAGGPWPVWPRDLFNFSSSFPALPALSGPPPVPFAAGIQAYYLFRQTLPLPPGIPPPWGESNYQTVAGSPANFERKTFRLQGLAGLIPGMEATFRLQVGQPGLDPMLPEGQPYWLSRLAVVPRTGPLKIRIEAVMYAYTGSWFVIPPPFFNDNRADTIKSYADTGLRAPGTQPYNGTDHPFYNEPLNVQVEVVGAVTENLPAEPSEKSVWTDRMWIDTSIYNVAAGGPAVTRPPNVFDNTRTQFAPDLVYRYDGSLRRMIRARIVRTGEEYIVLLTPVAGGGPPGGGVRTLQEVIDRATQLDSYVQTLPLLPKLPASAVVYEGSAL